MNGTTTRSVTAATTSLQPAAFIHPMMYRPVRCRSGLVLLVVLLSASGVGATGAQAQPARQSQSPTPKVAAETSVDDESEHGVADPGVYAYDPIAACLTDLACIGCNTLDQTIFGGRFRAVYQIVLGWTGVGTLIGGLIGFIGALVPGAFFGYTTFTAATAAGNPDEAMTNGFGVFCGTALFCAGAGAIALAVVGAAIGSIHAFVLWMTDELPGTRPPAWDEPKPRRRRAAQLEHPAPLRPDQTTTAAY